MTAVKVNRNIPQSAFKDQKTITSVFFGTECSSVGIDAFNGCISLSKINNDNGIIEIGGGAFASTSLSIIKLNKLNIIKSNEEQNGYGAFQGCSILTNISIQQCSSIGNNAFYSCANLKTVNINSKSANVKIGNNAFCGCENLSDIYFESCVAIGNNAFESCKSLEKANLKNCNDRLSDEKYKDNSIGQNAFCGCENLKEITLSYCEYGIGDSAFYNCYNLSRVYIDTSSVISLKSNVFYYGGDGIEPKIIDNIIFYMMRDTISIFTSDENSKYGWIPYKDRMVELPDSNQIVYITNNNKIIDIDGDYDYSDSDIYNEYNIITHIYNNFGLITFKKDIISLSKESLEGKEIFKCNKELTSIILPSNCEEVGENVFEGCTKLEAFIPSSTLTTIGDYAFKNCTSLESFNIPESVTDIGEGIFAGCSNIEKFEGNHVTYNNKAIVYNKTLISVAQSDNSETGGRYYKISEIDSDIESLGKSCFYGFNELIRVDISSNINRIGENAFDGCDNLQEVHFYGNVDLSKINFETNAFGIFGEGDTIKEGREDFKIFIPERIFKNINFESDGSDESDESDESDLYTFIKKYGKYIYPEPEEKQIIYYLNNSNVSDTDSDSNSNNKNYKTIRFYNDLSFEGDINISKVIFGEKITKINDYTFRNCTSLEYIYLPDTINTFGNECFSGCSSLKRICIPNNPLHNKTSFGDNLFYGCDSLMKFDSYYKNLVSEDGRCYIDEETLMFFAQGGLDEDKIYNIPYNIRKINKYAFKGSNITGIVISSNVLSIGESAFEGCSNLQSITFNNVSNISKCAFKNCVELKAISLPQTLKTIGHNSFATNGSINIYINANTKTPPKFVNDNGIENTNENILPFGEDPTNDSDFTFNIFVPDELYDTYINDKYWNKYKQYIKEY